MVPEPEHWVELIRIHQLQPSAQYRFKKYRYSVVKKSYDAVSERLEVFKPVGPTLLDNHIRAATDTVTCTWH